MNGVIKFITGKWGKILGVAMMGMTLVAIMFLIVRNYNEMIREGERQRNHNAQLEEVVRDMNEINNKLEDIRKTNQIILADTRRKNEQIVERHTEIERYLNSPEVQAKDGEASEIIKNTIRMLRDEE